MQMYPRDGGYKEHYYAAVEEDYIFQDECHNYNRGSSMQMMKPDHQHKHNNYDQHQMHGYGGYNDHHKKDRESYVAHSAEYWQEEDRRGDASWHMKNKNDYSGHGGKHHNGHEYSHNAGMRHNGYEGHEGHRGPHREHFQFSEFFEDKNNRAPIWAPKSIRD